jgi:hypothetical protein
MTMPKNVLSVGTTHPALKLVPVIALADISAIVATGNHLFNVTETIHHGRRFQGMGLWLEAVG